MKLTQTSVAKFKMPAGKSEHIEWDEAMPGFGLRCRSGEAREHRSFVVQYKIGAKHRRMTLGNAAKVTAEAARARATQIFGKLIDGADPANERAKARSAAANTFEVAAADFLDVQEGQIKPSFHAATTRYMNQHWKPLHGLALPSISRATIAAQLRVIEKERGPVSADRARAALSKFFSWAIGEGLAENNPVIGTNKFNEDVERDRVLTDVELAAIWNAAPDSDYGRIVRLLMLTAQRRDEIGSLRWSEIEGEDRTALIALPGSRTKNGRPHDVPLSKDAVAWLPPKRPGRDLVFGEAEGGFSGWGRAKQVLDEASGVKDWTLHDLRRTGATRMADSGVLPHVVEAALNHVSGHRKGVAGVYNRAAYAAEKRQALDTLATYIKTAVAKTSGANVTRLKRA
jgi:integrase